MRLPAVARAGVPRRARAASSGALPRDLRQAGARRERPDRHAAARHRAFLQLGGAFPPETVSPQRILPAAGAARAAPLPVPSTNREPGRIIDEAAYGMPSKFEGHVKRRRTDVLKNRQNLSDWSMTPLQHQPGIITPNGLVYERHHAGTPDIDPKAHRLVIHGLVKQPLEFSIDDLHRYPSVSRFYFLECSGNGLTDWLKPASTTVQQTHGLLSGALWTGVPMSTLLDEAGIDAKGKWALLEGADASAHTRSVPMEKMLD